MTAYPLTLLLLCLSLFSWGCVKSDNPLNRVKKWVILLSYQPDKYPVSAKEVGCYDMVIFDADYHPNLSYLNPKCHPIAYVSLGEAESYRSYWKDIKGSSWILGRNTNWEENYFVDPRASEWHKLILDTIIPAAMEQGFQGIFMDTLDTVDALAERDPENAASYQLAMTQLVEEIHQQYPELLLISNNGFTILSQIAPYLSGMLAEDILWMIDFENEGYRRVPKEWREAKLTILESLSSQYDLPVFVIDYVDPTNKKAIKEIKREMRRLGFHYYIAQKNLDRIYRSGNRICK